MNEECECSEDYGPCEDHCIVLAQREGASTRTADELSYVLIMDVIGASEADGLKRSDVLSPYGESVIEDVEKAWTDGSGWLDDRELADALYDVAHQVEDASDYWIIHDDGYVMVKVTGGPFNV